MVTTDKERQEYWAQWRKDRIAEYYARIEVIITGNPTSKVKQAIEQIRQYMATMHLKGDVWDGGWAVLNDEVSTAGIDEYYTPEDYIIQWDSASPNYIEASIDEFMTRININGHIEYYLDDFYDELFFVVAETRHGVDRNDIEGGW